MMNRYKYYIANDLKKEALGIVKADNKEQALKLCSRKKRLPIFIFQKLYKIQILQPTNYEKHKSIFSQGYTSV